MGQKRAFNLVEASGSRFSFRWDEWVPEERTLRLNEENLKRQKDLVESAKLTAQPAAPKKKEGSKEDGKPKEGKVEGAVDKGKGPATNKRKRESTADKVRLLRLLLLSDRR